jgi:hypothetical protein
MVQVGLSMNVRPYLINNQSKKGWDKAQVIQYLLSKHEALSSNPSTTQKEDCMISDFIVLKGLILLP